MGGQVDDRAEAACWCVTRGMVKQAVPLNEARHVCERRRDSEAAVSCENETGGRFQHPARHVRS